MKKIVAVILLITVIAAPIGLVGWKREWFVQTPTSIVTYSLMQANEGNYKAACENLPTGQRDQLLEEPALMKQVWDRITKNGTIASVKILKEQRGLDGRFGDIEIQIKYKDGSETIAGTKISYFNDRWSFGAAELSGAVDSARGDGTRSEMETWKIKLSTEYSRIGNSPVSLRVPEGLIWDRENQCYDHPKYKILVQLEPEFDKTFDTLEEFIQKQWGLPSRILERKEDISNKTAKVVLFDGDAVNEKGRGWRIMDLIIGQAGHATIISATFPNQKNFRDTMRECLKSARWEAAEPKQD